MGERSAGGVLGGGEEGTGISCTFFFRIFRSRVNNDPAAWMPIAGGWGFNEDRTSSIASSIASSTTTSIASATASSAIASTVLDFLDRLRWPGVLDVEDAFEKFSVDKPSIKLQK